MNIRLKVTEGPREGDEFVIKGDILIGRNKGDLQLRDGKVSSQHARITQESDGSYTLIDLGSSNGTLLNGKKVKKAALRPGDEIRLGRTTFVIEEADSRTSARPSLEKDS